MKYLHELVMEDMPKEAQIILPELETLDFIREGRNIVYRRKHVFIISTCSQSYNKDKYKIPFSHKSLFYCLSDIWINCQVQDSERLTDF